MRRLRRRVRQGDDGVPVPQRARGRASGASLGQAAIEVTVLDEDPVRDAREVRIAVSDHVLNRGCREHLWRDLEATGRLFKPAHLGIRDVYYDSRRWLRRGSLAPTGSPGSFDGRTAFLRRRAQNLAPRQPNAPCIRCGTASCSRASLYHQSCGTASCMRMLCVLHQSAAAIMLRSTHATKSGHATMKSPRSESNAAFQLRRAPITPTTAMSVAAQTTANEGGKLGCSQATRVNPPINPSSAMGVMFTRRSRPKTTSTHVG
jgi:hypothetical protein